MIEKVRATYADVPVLRTARTKEYATLGIRPGKIPEMVIAIPARGGGNFQHIVICISKFLHRDLTQCLVYLVQQGSNLINQDCETQSIHSLQEFDF